VATASSARKLLARCHGCIVLRSRYTAIIHGSEQVTQSLILAC